MPIFPYFVRRHQSKALGPSRLDPETMCVSHPRCRKNTCYTEQISVAAARLWEDAIQWRTLTAGSTMLMRSSTPGRTCGAASGSELRQLP